MAHGLSTRYVRTGPMNPANQVSAQEMFNRLYGKRLDNDAVLALAAEYGIADARLDGGQVVARHSVPAFGLTVLETAEDVTTLAANRARRSA